MIGKFTFGQDIHFSIYDLSPINQNPGNTGLFNGDYRFNFNYRTQWSAVTVPFKTINFAADATQLPKYKKFSGGIQFMQDITGDSQFKTTALLLSGAYKHYLKEDSLTYLSGGLQAGIVNKNLNYDPLYFDVQYNGNYYDPNLPTQENFNTNTRTYPTFSTGLSFFKQIAKRKVLRGGLALFNINKPKQSYFNDSDIKLDRRIVFHANGEWKVHEKINVVPSFQWMHQGKFNEVTIGGAAKYIITDFIGLYRTAWAGVYYRNKDAAYFTIGMDYDQWKVAISYDVNTSTLIPASNHRGAFEIAVIYIINSKPYKRIIHKICPDYI